MTARLQDRGIPVTAYEVEPDRPAGTMPLEHFPGLYADHTPNSVDLPYETAGFDAVLSCGVLEHVEDPDGSLDELHRVLSPGGRLYVYKLPNQRSYLEWIARRIGLYYHGSLPYDRLYSLATARELVERHGFAVRELRLTNVLPLTAIGRRQKISDVLWRANLALGRMPWLTRFATNVEVVADRC